jgi:hypothetical protein
VILRLSNVIRAEGKKPAKARIDSLDDRSDWKANGPAKSRQRRTLPFEIYPLQDWLHAGKRAMCVSVR